jgi:hypothetical protein
LILISLPLYNKKTGAEETRRVKFAVYSPGCELQGSVTKHHVEIESPGMDIPGDRKTINQKLSNL